MVGIIWYGLGNNWRCPGPLFAQMGMARLSRGNVMSANRGHLVYGLVRIDFPVARRPH